MTGVSPVKLYWIAGDAGANCPQVMLGKQPSVPTHVAMNALNLIESSGTVTRRNACLSPSCVNEF